MLLSNMFMAKNERIIAQDLSEIKYALQICDTSKIDELCEILTREIKKYPVKPDIVDRLEAISDYSNTSSSTKSTEEKIKEINKLVIILTSNR